MFFSSFILGLLTPLTAVCVLPLYPGYLSYIANNFSSEKENSSSLIIAGLLVTLGVLVFMTILGVLFSVVFQVSLTSVTQIISPIAFGLLGVISLLLIFNVDIGRFMPKIKTASVTKSKNPYFKAFLFGFFFGSIILPCNPAFIAAMFTTASTTTQFATNMFNFVMFGIGMAAPLLLFSIISAGASKQIIGFFTKYQRLINLVSGVLMLAISLYYLFFVFF